MDDETEEGGRRFSDRYGTPSAEVLHLLLLQMRESQIKFENTVEQALVKLETTMDKGFSRLETQFDQVEKRVAALEAFRERVQERDRALARAEGQFTMRWPAVTALITIVSLVVGIAVAFLSGGH